MVVADSFPIVLTLKTPINFVKVQQGHVHICTEQSTGHWQTLVATFQTDTQSDLPFLFI